MTAARSRFDSIMVTAKRPDVVMVEGRGSYLRDETGREYLDFVQGWAVNCLGHAPSVVAEAVAAQAARLINASPSFYTPPLLDLADQLSQERVRSRFFTNCGAEANEGAIKLARKWGQLHRGGATEIVTMRHAFHGRTLATMSASNKPGWDSLFEPKVPGFPKVAMNDFGAVERAIGPKTVAVMMELVQGESGVNPASEPFVRGVRQLTRAHDLLFIVDEVQTGIGRTGRLFAYEHFDVEPDIMTLGKGIAGAHPSARSSRARRSAASTPATRAGRSTAMLWSPPSEPRCFASSGSRRSSRTSARWVSTLARASARALGKTRRGRSARPRAAPCSRPRQEPRGRSREPRVRPRLAARRAVSQRPSFHASPQRDEHRGRQDDRSAPLSPLKLTVFVGLTGASPRRSPFIFLM